MPDRICLITGATQGIGRIAAIEIARQFSTVVIVGRDESRGAAAKRDIEQESGNRKVELLLADLSSLESVRKLADQFKSRHARLDLLVNNAGGIFTERRITVD